MPDPVSGDRHVLIRHVLSKVLAPAVEEGPQLRARHVEHGSNDSADAGADRSQTASTSAAQEPQQKSLGLVVPRMRSRDRVGAELVSSTVEEGVPLQAGGVFDRSLLLPCERRD